MIKKINCALLLLLFITSCADTFDSVKRGLTGQKKNTSEEFLVKKKDPLVLPPDFENLPMPDDEIQQVDENLLFEGTLETETKDNSAASGSVETSILKKIQSK